MKENLIKKWKDKKNSEMKKYVKNFFLSDYKNMAYK